MLLLFAKTLTLLAAFGFRSTAGCHPDAGIAVDVTANSALLIWSASTCDGVTDYAIYLASSTSTTDNPTSQQFITRVYSRTTYYRLSNLNPGSVYYYRVRPYKEDGELNTVSRGITVRTTPAVYGTPGITSITATSLYVTWTTCSGATRYYIDYKKSYSSYWMTVEVGNVRSTQITNLLPSTTYQFRVQCASSLGKSPYSSTRSATTLVDPVPSTTSISGITSITSRSLYVSWSTCSRASRYYIDYRRSSSSYWMTVEVGDVRSTQITNLVPSTTYYFRVQCASASGRSLYYSSIRSATTLVDPVPSTTSISGITSITARSLYVSWSTCSRASKYYIDYRRSSSSYWMTVEVGDVRTTQINNLVPSTTYYFRVQCASASGRSLDYSSIRSATTLVDPVLSAPRFPGINSITARSLYVSWSTCSRASRYYIDYRISSSSYWMTVEVGDVRSTQITNLLPSTRYYFRVQCANAIGRSPYSSTRSATTLVDPDSLRPTVSNVKANSTSAMVAWIPAARGQNVLTSYEVLVSSGSQQQIHTAAGSRRTAFTVSNLQPETAYSYQVRAVSSSDDRSSWSPPQTGITLPLYPGEEINVTLNETTASTISVSWTRIRFRVDWYMLTIQSVFAENLSAVEIAVINSTESYTFHDLLPLTDYTINVWAVNRAGNGPNSTLNATTNALRLAPETTSTDLLISTSALATLLAILILCLIITFVLLKCRKGHKTDSGATAQVRFSTKADEVEMEGNAAYAAVEYGKHYNDYQEDTMSINDETVLNRPLPPRIRVDDEQYAIPTMPVQPSQISEPVYADSESFQKYSGWFMPSVNEVLTDKLGLNDEDFVKLGSGIFYMFHKTKMKAKYIGFAANLPVALCGTIHNLYKKEMSSMTPIEVELKYFSPKAEDWIVQVWQCEKEALLVERAKMIIEKQTLKPHGLNRSLKIPCKQGWGGFTEWYTDAKKPQKKGK